MRLCILFLQVHWAMTVSATNNIQHFIDGSVSTTVGYSPAWCGEQGGALIIGHDQVRVYVFVLLPKLLL